MATANGLYESPFGLVQFPGLSLTATYVAVTAADSVVLAANQDRRWLAIFNRDTGFVDLAENVAAVAGQGMPLVASGALGGQGGSYVWDNGAPLGAIHAIAPAGSHITIIEGV